MANYRNEKTRDCHVVISGLHGLGINLSDQSTCTNMDSLVKLEIDPGRTTGCLCLLLVEILCSDHVLGFFFMNAGVRVSTSKIRRMLKAI